MTDVKKERMMLMTISCHNWYMYEQHIKVYLFINYFTEL